MRRREFIAYLGSTLATWAAAAQTITRISSQGTGYFLVPSSNIATVAAPTILNARPFSTQNTLFNVPNGGTCTANNVKIYGTSSNPGATVAVYLGEVLQGTTTTAPDGTWNFAPGILADGGYTISATLTSSGI